MRRGLAKRADHGGQRAIQRRRHEADHDALGQLREASRERSEFVGFVDQTLGLCIENAAGFGQPQRPRSAFEQRQADVFLDLLDLAAERRLRHMQAM